MKFPKVSLKGNRCRVELTAAEQSALDREIQRQCAAGKAKFDKEHAREIVAMFLWTSHEIFGHGPLKMKRQYIQFTTQLKALIEKFEMDDFDGAWLCTRQLEQYLAKHGTSLDDWDKESEEETCEDS